MSGSLTARGTLQPVLDMTFSLRRKDYVRTIPRSLRQIPVLSFQGGSVCHLPGDGIGSAGQAYWFETSCETAFQVVVEQNGEAEDFVKNEILSAMRVEGK